MRRWRAGVRGAALAVAVALGASPGAAPAGPQTTPPAQPPQQTPTFRGGTQTVAIYATVNDRDGGFAVDLRKEDFEVRDNGVLQKITQFSTSEAPVSAVLLLDGSGSMLPVFDAVLDAASSFVIRMRPGDRVQIGSFADLVRMSPTFSSNRDDLLAYLRNQFNIRMANDTRLWDAIHDALLHLSALPGRRVVFVVSDGYDTDSGASLDGVTSEAVHHNVSIYAIAMWTGQGLSRTRPNTALQRLAGDTGGGFYELSATDEMNTTFTRIALELHQQYVLGFTPQKLDGRVHDLDVRVKRADMKVRARKSYLAEPDR